MKEIFRGEGDDIMNVVFTRPKITLRVRTTKHFRPATTFDTELAAAANASADRPWLSGVTSSHGPVGEK